MIYRNGLLPSLFEREVLGYKRSYVPNQFSYAFVCEGKHAGLIRVDPLGDPRPPYCITYNKVVNGCRFLTVGDEEGSVSIVDTRAEQLPSSLYTDHATPPRARWLAHNNTIFDMAWAKNDSILFTASGDQHVGVWDTTAGRLLVYCAGHNGSVKAVSPHSSQPDMFASGSRDGAILLWDLRTPSSWSAAKRRMQLSPVMRVDTTTADGQQFSQPAAAADAGGGGTARRARKSKRDCMSRRSVTSLLFVRQEHTMISSSDCDGVIKLWDLRKLTVPTGDLTLPSGPAGGVCSAAAARTPGAARTRADGRSVDGPAGSHLGVGGNGADTEGLSWLGFSGASRNSRAAGITCMALSPTGDMLLVSSIDSCHYVYRVSSLDQEPMACLTGHRNSSFCVKSCFSPSGSHVLSGSTDNRAYIWDVSRPADPPASLAGHAGEVTAVAWCPADHNQIATAADDATLRVWTMDRANARYERHYQRTNALFPAQDGQQPQGLWERSGLAARRSLIVQTQTLAAGDKGTGTAATAAHMSAGSVAAAEGAAAPGAVRGTYAPVTPQLPLWTADAAGGGGDTSTLPTAGNTVGTPAVTAQVMHVTPAGRKGKAVEAGMSPSLPPLHPAAATAAAPQQSAAPKLKQITIAQQLSAIKAKQMSAAARKETAAAKSDAPAEDGHAHVPMPSSHRQQDAPYDNRVSGNADAPPAAAGPASATNPCGSPEQHSRHPLPFIGQLPRMDDKAAAAAAAGNNSSVAPNQQQAIADWMNTLTPSPASSPGSQRQHQRASPSRPPHRPAGGVELSTPWDLPTPLLQQRQQQHAALEAERLQQSMQLRGLSLQECDGSPSGSGNSCAAAGSRGMAGMSCCRLLQDEFEVYCDAKDMQTAAAAAGALQSLGTAPTTQGGYCQENLWQQQAARQDSITPAAATAGDDIIEESPVDIDMVPCSLPSQDVMHCCFPPRYSTQHTQQQQQQEVAEVLHQSPEPQMTQAVRGVRSPQQHRHQHPSLDSPTAAPGGDAVLLVAGSKPGFTLLSGAVRTPLGDLSPLLPGQHVESRSGASPLVAATAGAGPVAQHTADIATGSPSLQMMLQGKLPAGKQQLQQPRMDGCPTQWPVKGSRAKHSALLSPRPSQWPSAGRQLSRFGDRQISPLMASKQLLTPARSLQQQQQRLDVSVATADDDGGVFSMLQAGWANSIPTTGEQQQPGPVLPNKDNNFKPAEATGHQQQQQQTPVGTGGNKGGIKRSYVFGGSNRKKQCRLSDRWTSEEPEVEDGASRFSGL